MKTKITVNGMSCMHCVNHVKECLSELENVKSVEVNLDSKTAIVESSDNLNEEKVKDALDDYGYEAVAFEEI
ncbi:MAG: heavy-metal-associated domain-containing protein [Clostridium argentinense]|uniref:heavy-metal-associated domain-containing protein n=1 Tax=Clostridium butanoliproducens TaxID=2991837 RepID=UPI001D41E471|nr:heavy metal-associated domain-containing protein [Clostridium butanoliproducens]MBS5825403.1 heavy-metal-associated domain-containing protein [Clostridium argentinense]MDU1348747.1 heavy metal-associated domain-containing protein [Clostridium argentinense]